MSAVVFVVIVAIGAVALLVPSGGNASSSGSDAAGPPLPGAGVAGYRPGDPAAWVIAENQKPGTSAWQVSGPIDHGNIEGYADTTSAVHGDSVRLFVSTDSTGYHVEAYRMGYYGGKQGRLVWQSPTLPGSRQAPPTIDFRTNTAEAKWRQSLTLNIDNSWPPGDYLIKLVADNGYQQFVPLAVRDDTSRAPLLIMNSVTTWQAYNKWGGYSLYEGTTGRNGSSGDARAKIVSFDRPYFNDSGAGDFLGNELPLVTLVESLGIDVSYWTDVDLHARPQLLANHTALISLGHDEYWSLEMRQAVEHARDSGTNIAFLGANALYRAIRLAPSDLGPDRHEINYRATAGDPLYGVDNSRMTVSWREPPLNKPESSLVGTYYDCNPVKADMVVADPAAWVFDGTGVTAGEKLKDAVGPEYDHYDKSAPQPPGSVQILSHSPLKCHGKATYSDMTYYSTPSGSGVFATGTNWWISRLGPACPPNDCVDEKIVHITENVLRAFAAGPAGQQHPSIANAAQVGAATTTSSTIYSATTTTEQEGPEQENTTPSTRYVSGLTTTSYGFPFSVPSTEPTTALRR
jgi:hypothetical protein